MDAVTPDIEATPEAALETAFDVDAFARDLDDVEVALSRLDDGRYWTCEVTGEPLPAELLATDPIARRRRVPDGPGGDTGDTTED